MSAALPVFLASRSSSATSPMARSQTSPSTPMRPSPSLLLSRPPFSVVTRLRRPETSFCSTSPLSPSLAFRASRHSQPHAHHSCSHYRSLIHTNPNSPMSNVPGNVPLTHAHSLPPPPPFQVDLIEISPSQRGCFDHHHLVEIIANNCTVPAYIVLSCSSAMPRWIEL